MKLLSPSLKKLIKVLNDGEFHSGESLGKTLAISRNAIWKHINQLTKFGIDIESAQSKGYCLKQLLILLDKNSIKKNLWYSGKFVPNKIEILGSLTSTNDYLKDLPINNPNEIAICLAEQQTAGRGRFGRVWHSPFAANIYLSCRWCVSKDVSQLNGLSMVAALAVMNALHATQFKTNLSVKWPNDILYHAKKLAGILIEINAESHGLTQVIIGIGLNVNMTLTANAKIDRAWTSLAQISGYYQDRNSITGLLISHLLQNLERFNEAGFAAFTDEWKRHDGLYGKKISLDVNKDAIHGIAMGVNDHGHLLLKNGAGVISAYSAGEASLHLS